MAKREVAYTYLDVKYPQLVCKGCESEFEFLEADCTHPNVSFSPPIGLSSKGKGKSKGTKGANGDHGVKGKGKGAYATEYKGKGKGKGEGGTSDIDIMALLHQYGSGIISEQQALMIKNAMKISPAAPKPKSPLQIAKSNYKSALAELNVSKNKLEQSKESVLALDKKFKAALITVCENTQEYTSLKHSAEELKIRLDELSVNIDSEIDERIADLAASHASAMSQLNVPDSEDEADAAADAHPLEDDNAAGNSDDFEGVYNKMQNLPEAAEAEDADMQQAAIKRPMLPSLDISASCSSTEDIMCKLHELNCAKKTKLTPRGGSNDDE